MHGRTPKVRERPLLPHEVLPPVPSARERRWRRWVDRWGLAGRMLDGRERMPMLVIGMSHTMAVLEALRAAHLPGVRVCNVQLHSALEARGLHDVFLDAFRPSITVSMNTGGQYAQIGLLEPAEPFDFEDAQGGPPIDGRRPVPRAEVKAALAWRLKGAIVMLQRLQDAFGPPLAHVAAPPPPERVSDAFSRYHLYGHRGDGAPVAAPASVRLKLYRLQNEIMTEACARLGLRFIGPPDGATLDCGFCDPAFGSEDPIHGNVRYGLMVRDQLVAFAAEHGFELSTRRGH